MRSHRCSHFDSMIARVARGALAGLAATVVLRQIGRVVRTERPESSPPMRGDPGEVMVERAEAALPNGTRAHVPATMEQAAARSLALGYGATLAVLYALARPRGGHVLADGLMLGLGAWGIAFLGWLPALDMAAPVTRQTPLQIAVPVVEHAVYGLAATGAYEGIRRVQRRL